MCVSICVYVGMRVDLCKFALSMHTVYAKNVYIILPSKDFSIFTMMLTVLVSCLLW